MARITKEELLEKLFHEDYEQLKGKQLRITPGLKSIRTWGSISASMRVRTTQESPSA